MGENKDLLVHIAKSKDISEQMGKEEFLLEVGYQWGSCKERIELPPHLSGLHKWSVTLKDKDNVGGNFCICSNRHSLVSFSKVHEGSGTFPNPRPPKGDMPSKLSILHAWSLEGVTCMWKMLATQ